MLLFQAEKGGGLDKNIAMGLIVSGGIFGGILLIFVLLCCWSHRNKQRSPVNAMNVSLEAERSFQS